MVLLQPTLMTQVLSLPRAVERRRAFTAMCGNANLPGWTFFDALPPGAVDLNYDPAQARQRHGRELTPPELSCHAGHLAMIRAFLANDKAEVGLFLEDDVILDPQFNFATAAALMVQGGVDYLKLFARFYVPAQLISRIGRFTLYRCSWPALGTQAYLLTRAGAARMVEILGRPVTAPVDDMCDDFAAHGMPAFLLFPFPVMEMNTQSSVAPPEAPSQASAPLSFGQRVDGLRLKILKRGRRVLADRRLRREDARVRQLIGASHEALRLMLHTPVDGQMFVGAQVEDHKERT